MLLDAPDAATAEAVIERLRHVTPFDQTVSAGIAVWDGCEPADATMHRADEALYAAKRLGRDRCVGPAQLLVG